ncbi:carbohydrate ABC transporter substrate-binding protein, CUT1 family [Faunimonas pinastri]|uniref:Carbohydrate ABC transporter substrate-binding protein, CUT1 family n=1 Tax=Faunimonas pinastri TaxID=1855383 RepID=A0A1H9PHH2_9HYPH|nr:extracellular solute-binding protein [Faunimonas pinastri]SER47013.1 carbohydrate ABC transporter substrate-binding protein, CUT1 family [Faunimonas pinastri]
MTIILKGMTWSHPRGYDPMVACSESWREKTGVAIRWDKRSLQDFESFPVDELARAYDLIVIDHPHVGQITEEGCLAPLDVPGREAEREAMAKGSVGASYPSYFWQGHQWAFPIDAATQVQAWRPDLTPSPLTDWEAVLQLSREGKVLIPLLPPHSLMSFFTLAANTGTPCASEAGREFIAPADGKCVFDLLREIADLVDPSCFEMDPIAVLERMGEAASPIACAPLIYGYVSYSLDGFRPARVAFANIPAVGSSGPVGGALGGTGIAVSARSEHRKEATDFAYFVAGGDAQRGPYAGAGGQPGHADAWEDEAVNQRVANFYRATRETLEGSYLRPRHNGYMPFQHAASERLNAGLKAREDGAAVIADLNRLYRESFSDLALASDGD